MNARRMATSLILTATVAALAFASAPAGAQADKTKAPTTLTTFWAFPGTPNTMTLVVAGQPEPVAFNVAGDMQFGGVCAHCTLNQPFKVSEVKEICKPCGCGKTNGCCIAWKDLKQNSWEELMNTLPVGVVMKATFNTPNTPSSGIKSLWVDRRTLLVPVDGLAGKSPAEITTIVKAIGGTKGELIDGDKRLVVYLKSEWDTDQSPKLEKALAKVNAKIVRPEKTVASK